MDTETCSVIGAGELSDDRPTYTASSNARRPAPHNAHPHHWNVIAGQALDVTPSSAAAETPSWTDQAQAWGTLAAVLIALAALIVTIILAKQDRIRAQEQLQAEREERRREQQQANQELEEERRRTSGEMLRRHHLRILMEASEQYARSCAMSGMPQGSEANERLRVLARLLPDGQAVLIKRRLGLELTALESSRLGDIGQRHGEPIPPDPPTGWVHEELRENAEEIITRPALPE
ncbi:hypothetical protein [Streptomyces mirabilis]